MELSAAKQYKEGVKAALPIIMGFIPVGIAFAVMAGEAGLAPWQMVLMSMLVFAGASQIMSVGMIAQGAAFGTIVAATFILNLRHIIMSTCVMNRMKKTSTAARVAASFGVTDESFAIFTTIEEKKCTIWYFLGVITVTYGSWVAGTALGAIASNFLPRIVSDSLDIALYALFIALLVPGLKGNLRLLILVLVTAVINWLLCLVMDNSWAMIVSTLVCAGIGVFVTDDGKEEGNGKAAADNGNDAGDVYTQDASRGADK